MSEIKSEIKKMQKELVLQIFETTKLSYELQFHPIKFYLENSQKTILLCEKELEEKYNKYNEHIQYLMELSELRKLTTKQLPDILNKSVYLTIYSMFENEFFKLCESLQKIENLNLGPKDLKGGSYIALCNNYIKKVINVNLDRFKNEWEITEKYQQIRNLIAHNNGIIKPNNKEIIKFINTTEGISFDKNSLFINIDSVTFLNMLIDHLVKYLNDIIDEIQIQKYK
ncbi:hypothetical protein DNU06_15565 [Putridiphycobacter roseus]|uniref:MAE-28990/MAE-18760-like HEPN domain-containing protein n=1 Tax=Putridiphycobacter roseus TaxID=2219161 RepID=A0A2W1N9I4_9FLAO|nr:hypothetical protein [Putridiphycobacter roseus]PZE15925.1 hypothetical protein DNU06_15565 [Putridiphycobacter roseus]